MIIGKLLSCLTSKIMGAKISKLGFRISTHMITLQTFKQITPYLWELPKSYQKGMRVPARIYITKDMLEDILDERSVEQLLNVATLPGIERYALAMPDIHQGYGFPIGGVAAMRTKDGVISPGGVGDYIN